MDHSAQPMYLFMYLATMQDGAKKMTMDIVQIYMQIGYLEVEKTDQEVPHDQ